MKHIHWIAKIIAVSLCSSVLLGCVNAAMTGAQAAINHNSLKNTINDQYITTQAYRKVYKDTNQYSDTNLSIATFHRKVLLAGQVSSLEEKQAIGALIKDIPDVERVYNVTEISPPSSAFTRLSDTWITTKVKTKLIANDEINPDQIKVVTENGTVYLMGTLLADQANIAAELASTTDGVQNVVKIFTYLQVVKS